MKNRKKSFTEDDLPLTKTRSSSDDLLPHNKTHSNFVFADFFVSTEAS